jgi:uncharacterized membrane protein
MSPKRQSPLRIVRIARAHVRLWASIAIGAAVFVLLPGSWNTVTRVLIGWDVGVACYLIAAATMMARSPVAELRRHSKSQDEGALAIMLLTLAAAGTSLIAIFLELAETREEARGFGPYAIAIATVVLSWLFTHTIFALHYAYEFYGEGDRTRGLDFPGGAQPDYWDFIYFSFVIGMTFQVSDVAVTNKGIRRSVVVHGVLSFFFNAAVVALTVNMAANAL